MLPNFSPLEVDNSPSDAIMFESSSSSNIKSESVSLSDKRPNIPRFLLETALLTENYK